MTDENLVTIEPISSSADGKRNAYIVNCGTTGQSLSYAACLHRIKSIEQGNAPSDWNACDRARGAGACKAVQMREEEALAGKSIYFTARAALASAVEGARQWVSSWSKPVEKKTRRTAAPRDALDAMGGLGTYADAISKGDIAPPAAPLKRVVIPIAQTGESPLQMAMRLKRERANAA